jgi:hypothetical protein
MVNRANICSPLLIYILRIFKIEYQINEFDISKIFKFFFNILTKEDILLIITQDAAVPASVLTKCHYRLMKAFSAETCHSVLYLCNLLV